MMNLSKGSKVWVADTAAAWVAAEVVDLVGKQVQVLTSSGEKLLASQEKLHLRDEDQEIGGVDDMTNLTYLNEPEVLFNLERRYGLNDIYTYTGSILIAVNPFTKLPHLYNVHMMEQYRGAPFGQLSPHVFAVADASYRAMINDTKSQSILVSGESGAGKTETTKLIMQFLTFVGGRIGGDDRTVAQQLLESNPLLEAFGNARTVRNDNSSRFGKFVEIQFGANGRISGAAIRTYLLERSRVVQITNPERNYHCFYHLCASGRDAEKYKLEHPSHFHYLNQSKTYELDGMSSAKEYLKTRRAMDIVGISSTDQEAIFRTLAAILHLGNIEFSPGEEHDSSVIKDQRSNFHMQMTADLFMCDANLLLATLCTRTIQTREGNILKALDCNAATASRDALAKTVYARLFDWLVDKINNSIGQVGQDQKSNLQIGVLDIYGFECFDHNSFEQFCINFANEKLQQHFNEHVFKMEQEEYSKEEINWSYIEFIDNQDVLDLIEKQLSILSKGILPTYVLYCMVKKYPSLSYLEDFYCIEKPIGIIALLDEACMFPRATNKTFSGKLYQNFKTSFRFQKPKFSETDFTISHYAGKVTYKTDSFLDKNRDYVIVEHSNLLSSSKCHFVAGLFSAQPEESSRSSYKFSSVSTRFKQQLQALMDTLNSTEPHYVRCVKPNSLNQPKKFEKAGVLHQLRCGGVLEAIRISLAGYPTRRFYVEFIDRFGLLVPEFMDGSYDERTITEKILKKLKLENFQLGKTKVFLRAAQIGVLDSRRTEILDSAAKKVQWMFRSYTARKLFISIRAASSAIQAYIRGCLARQLYEVKRQTAAAIDIQTYIRGSLLRHTYVQTHVAAITLQSIIRGFAVRQKFSDLKRTIAASVIQARWRTYKFQKNYMQYKTSVIRLQCLWRQKLARRELKRLKKEANEAGAWRLAKSKLEKELEDLTWRLQLEKRLRISNEEAKLEEISKMKKYMESLTLELDAAKVATINERNKNAVLQTQLDLSVKEKSALQRELASIAELKKENAYLTSSLDTLESKKVALEVALAKAQKESSDAIEKLQEMELNNSQLQEILKSLHLKVSNLEDENHILRQRTLAVIPKNVRTIFTKSTSDKFPGRASDRRLEIPSPTKRALQFLPGTSESRPKLAAESHQEYYVFLSRCIKEQLGFKDGKPLAACVIYRCLLHWHAFESERTAIFDHIIEGIDEVLKGGDDNITFPYWLSNTTALLWLLQRNLRSNGFFNLLAQRSPRSPGSSGLTPRVVHMKSPFRPTGFDDGYSHKEAKYPAILFKQQLTACVEKIFGLIRDNMKKELLPLLGSCVQAPKSARHTSKSSRSSDSIHQQSPNNQWDSIVNFLDSLVIRLRDNHVPLFFIRKLVIQVFLFINVQLFNSLLLRRECCTFSNGEHVKSGLAELEKWVVNAKEEVAGNSWEELKFIRQAVGFLVIHQKRKKSLEEIKKDLCPALTVRQIYRISTMYFDDKYGTQSVSNEVVTQMREILDKDSQNLLSNSFLLDDDLSIPFSSEDIDTEIPGIDPMNIEIPKSLADHSCAQFLIQQPINS